MQAPPNSIRRSQDKSLSRQRIVQSSEEAQRAGVVAMNANGADAALTNEPVYLSYRFIGILDESIRPGARDKTPIGQVTAIGKTLSDKSATAGAERFEP